MEFSERSNYTTVLGPHQHTPDSNFQQIGEGGWEPGVGSVTNLGTKITPNPKIPTLSRSPD